MTDGTPPPTTAASLEEIEQGWHELKLKLSQLESAKVALERENKALRQLLERALEHRQKSHTELVLLLTGLVSKLPINDVGVIVSKLMEHNANMSEYLGVLLKGAGDAALPQPAVLKTLDQTRRELQAALKPVIAQLLELNTPFEGEALQSLGEKPELFFSPKMVRANRCFLKGHIARERVLKEFGSEALVFFQDLTTDPKLNPRPKPEEIVLGFRNDFEALFQQNPGLLPGKREKLLELHHRVQRSKSAAEARLQRGAFQRLSFLIELLHYYEHQSTEPADVIFAQRLPALVEQMVLAAPSDALEEKLISQAEKLLAFVISSDHRMMIINNLGKSSIEGKTLKHILRLRTTKLPEPEQAAAEFAKHLLTLSPSKPSPDALVPVLRLFQQEMQRLVVRAIMHSDRLRRTEGEALGKAVAAALNLPSLAEEPKPLAPVSPELDRQLAWARIKDMIVRKMDPGAVAAAIRERLNAKYDADEIRQSWITLTEADPLNLIRIFCHLPYMANGKTDPIARPVLEIYITRLLHEKYAATYIKIVKSLKNLFKAKSDAPTLVNYLALVRWVSPEAADKMCADIGMTAAAK